MFECYKKEQYDWYLYSDNFVIYGGGNYGFYYIYGYYLIIQYVVEENGYLVGSIIFCVFQGMGFVNIGNFGFYWVGFGIEFYGKYKCYYKSDGQCIVEVF